MLFTNFSYHQKKKEKKKCWILKAPVDLQMFLTLAIWISSQDQTSYSFCQYAI